MFIMQQGHSGSHVCVSAEEGAHMGSVGPDGMPIPATRGPSATVESEGVQVAPEAGNTANESVEG